MLTDPLEDPAAMLITAPLLSVTRTAVCGSFYRLAA